MDKLPAIGIDLGTTACCMAVVLNDKVEVISNNQGNKTTPSYVAFTESGRLMGNEAKDQAAFNPTNTVFGVKRLIGRNFTDETLKSDMKQWPFKVVNEEGKPKIEVEYKAETKRFFPEEISSMVLTKMKETAEAYLGNPVTNAVISIPCQFNSAQRQATKNAAEIAGLNVLRLVSDTSATAYTYAQKKKNVGTRNIFVFDLGGGSSTVSIIIIEDGCISVSAKCGHMYLGGEDFDNRLVNHFIQEFKRKNKKDITDNKRAVRRLRTACEMAKRTLSSSTQASIEIDSLFEGIDFYTRITRARFEELNADLFRGTLEPVEKALRDAKMSKGEIHDIVLVGGSTRIPKVQKLLQDFFNGKELNKSINPDEAVAYGAALLAKTLQEGPQGNQSRMLEDLEVLFDATPKTLGIETYDGLMRCFIKRNTAIPTSQTESFHCHNTRPLIINIYEGEETLVKHNYLLETIEFAEFAALQNDTEPNIGQEQPDSFPSLSNPGRDPKSGNNDIHDMALVEITFSINCNLDLNVSVVEKVTGKRKDINILRTKDNLTELQIAEIKQNAAKYKMEDEKEMDRLCARDELSDYVYRITSMVNDDTLPGRMNSPDKRKIVDKCNEILTWLDSNQLAEEHLFHCRRKELDSIWNDNQFEVSGRKQNRREWFADSNMGGIDTAESGSDDYKNIDCSHCNNPDKLVVKFCENCLHRLCSDCCESHDDYFKINNHKVVDFMPTGSFDDRKLSRICLKHHMKLIEFYCQSHEECLCSFCFHQLHTMCQVECIQATVDAKSMDTDFKNALSEMDRLVGCLNERVTSDEMIVNEGQKKEQEELHRIDKLVKRLHERLDEMKKSATANLRSAFHVEIRKVEGRVKQNANIKADIEASKCEIEEFGAIGDKTNLYIATKHAIKSVKQYQKDVEEQMRQQLGSKPVDIEFKFKDVFKYLDELGQVEKK